MIGIDIGARAMARQAAALHDEMATASGADSVGFSQPESGATSRAAGEKLRDRVSVEDFGGKADGSDNTAAIKAALAAVDNRGGGDVYFPRAGSGGYGWKGVIDVPNGVNLVGQGASTVGAPNCKGSRLVALDASAQIRFTSTNLAGNRGGATRGLVIDGAGIGGANAGGLLFLDVCVQRSFNDILVMNSAGDCMVIERAQNNRFFNLHLYKAEKNCLRIGRGAGGNCFFGAEIEGAGEYHLNIDDATNDGPYIRPTHNAFYHSIFERKNASVSTHLGSVRLVDSENTLFHSCVFHADSIAGNDAVLQVGDGSSAATVILDNCIISIPADGKGIRMETSAAVYNEGTLWMYGGSVGWQVNGGYGRRGQTRFNGQATPFAGPGLFSLPNGFDGGARITVEEWAAGKVEGSPFSINVRGEATDRFRFEVTQGLRFGNGSVLDSKIYRPGPNVLQTGGEWVSTTGLRLNSAGGPLIRSGAGSPEGVLTAPVGSIWTRTDGGDGATLYVKESGTGNTGWIVH